MNHQLLPPSSAEALRQLSAPPTPLSPRREPIPDIALHVLGVMLLVIAAAAVVAMTSGCGGNALYAEGMTDEQIAPIRDAWEAIGAPANIVAVPRGGVPAHGDRIRFVRHGYLQAIAGRGTDSCAFTPTGGLVVWDGAFETRDITIDADCVEAHGATLQTGLRHETGHWLGLLHLPPGELGVMAGDGSQDDGLDHDLSCADKRLWAAFAGTRADCEDVP